MHFCDDLGKPQTSSLVCRLAGIHLSLILINISCKHMFIKIWVWLVLDFLEYPPSQCNSIFHFGQLLQAKHSPPLTVAFPVQPSSSSGTPF